MDRKLFARLYGRPILEMNALQRKALLDGRMVNAEGRLATSWSLCEIELRYWGEAHSEPISPTLRHTVRGPQKRHPVTLAFGKGDLEDVPDGLQPGFWLELYVNQLEIGAYWLPQDAEIDFTG